MCVQICLFMYSSAKEINIAKKSLVLVKSKKFGDFCQNSKVCGLSFSKYMNLLRLFIRKENNL